MSNTTQFFTENGTRYGTRFHKMKVYSTLNRNPNTDYAYQEHMEIGPYVAEYHSVTKMVNLTRLNDELNKKLGKTRKFKEFTRATGVQKLINSYSMEERLVMLAEDESGEIWGYRTLAAEMVLMRDMAVKKEVYEKFIDGSFIRKYDDASTAMQQLARVIWDKMLIHRSGRTSVATPTSGAGRNSRHLVTLNWNDLPQAIKDLVLHVDNLIKVKWQIQKWSNKAQEPGAYDDRKKVFETLTAMFETGMFKNQQHFFEVAEKLI